MKGKWFLIILAVVLILLVFPLVNSYNKLITLNENIDAAWAQVENRLKQRADLIPNLLETVKGYAGHEKEVIGSIAEARSMYTNANTVQEYAEAEQGFNNAIRNLNLVVENYPDLKANQNFIEFQTELTGMENRISTERLRYNDAVKEYNTIIKRIPQNIIAGLFNFEQREYFQIRTEDAEVPKVNF